MPSQHSVIQKYCFPDEPYEAQLPAHPVQTLTASPFVLSREYLTVPWENLSCEPRERALKTLVECAGIGYEVCQYANNSERGKVLNTALFVLAPSMGQRNDRLLSVYLNLLPSPGLPTKLQCHPSVHCPLVKTKQTQKLSVQNDYLCFTSK